MKTCSFLHENKLSAFLEAKLITGVFELKDIYYGHFLHENKLPAFFA